MAKQAGNKKKQKAPKGSVGRPDKLTPEIQSKIVTAVRAGAFIETAASYAGISKVTLYDWMKRGNKATTGKFRDFNNAVTQAFAEATVADLAQISAAAAKDWRAAAYRLEKRERNLYGNHVQISATGGNLPEPVEIILKVVDPTNAYEDQL